MERSAIKELMYGGINELMHNHKYYYYSDVGGDYCHWTEEGKAALIEYMNMISYRMMRAEEEDINKRSKDLVMKGLKGDGV
jgi:hypothetical protein